MLSVMSRNIKMFVMIQFTLKSKGRGGGGGAGLLIKCQRLPRGFLWNTSPPPLDCRLFYCLKREVHNSKKEGSGIKRTEVDDKALNFGK